MCGALALGAWAAVTPSAAASSPEWPAGATSCVLAQGVPDFSWHTAAADEALRAVEDAVRARFVKPRQYRTELLRGLIGIAMDFTARDIVVVVDPNLVDTAHLQRELRSVLRRALPDDDQSGLGVRVQAGCHPGPDLYEVFRFLTHEFRLLTRSATDFGLNVRNSSWRVCNEDEVANALLETRFGDLVKVETGCLIWG